MKNSHTNVLAEVLIITLWIAAAGFSIFLGKNLQFRTNYVFAAVLLLFAATAIIELGLRNRPGMPALIMRVSGSLFLSYFFIFFIAGLMLWNRFGNPVFQTRLLVFAAVSLALTAAVHARISFSKAAAHHQKLLHSNTFYFGLVFAMSVFMMKYRDPVRVDAIGTVSLGLFSLLQAVTLLKPPPGRERRSSK